MVGIKTGKENFLRCKPAETIDAPGEVSLAEEFLVWQVAYEQFRMDNTAATAQLSPRPVAGCLNEFANLADAIPTEVLSFTRKRGVLEIDPEVTEEWANNDGRRFRLRYREHFSIYTELARQTRNILAVMQSMRDGKGVRKTDLMGCLPGALGTGLVSHRIVSDELSYGEDAYRILSASLHIWWDVASAKMSVPYLNRRDASSRRPLDFLLGFGHWNDGFAWDDRKLHPAAFSRDESDVSHQIEAYQKHIRARDPWHYRAMLLPGSHQRPSPLFNAITFQLIREVTFPGGWYFCANERCRKLYDHEAVWGELKNKPRSDKSGGWCSIECEVEYKKRNDRERKRKKASACRSAASPQQ